MRFGGCGAQIRTRFLWIDQLCIDQANLEEKKQQVQLMSRIYSECSRGVVWVGELSEGVPLADARAGIQLLQCMAACPDAYNLDDLALPPAIHSGLGAAIDALGGIGYGQNPWWSRIWTVQEATLPEHVVMQWGAFELPWTMLLGARNTWMQMDDDSLPVSGDRWNVFNYLFTHLTWLHSAKDADDRPCSMIHRYRLRRATDPRDKIYGLLGLCAKNRLPVTQKCDYTVSTAQVFQTMTQELIIDEAGLQPLTCHPRQHPSQATPGIASWALDLNHSTPPYSGDLYYYMHGYDAYGAADGLDAIDLDAIKAQVGQATLSLTGVSIDTITRLHERGWLTAGRDLSAILHQWYEAALGSAFDATHELPRDLYTDSSYSRAEAFARLILGDVIRGGGQAPLRRTNESDYQAVWRFMRGEADENTRDRVYKTVEDRTMFVTQTGLIGCGHLDTRVGDEVWVFRGGNVPFVISPRTGEKEEGYRFVGDCYVQGIMHGEKVMQGKGLWNRLCVCIENGMDEMDERVRRCMDGDAGN